MVYGSNQWISFDDAESFGAKVKYMTSRCLKGLMIWSIDWDTSQLAGSTALFGDEAMSRAIIEDSLDDRERNALVADLAAFTGQNCYTTHTCVSSDSASDPGASCQGGYSSVAVAHNPAHIGAPSFGGDATCPKGSWKHICCPTKQTPKNCEWTPSTSSLTEAFGICRSGCGEDQFELTTDSSTDFRGDQACSFFSHRSVSANSSPLLTLILLLLPCSDYFANGPSYVAMHPKSCKNATGHPIVGQQRLDQVFVPTTKLKSLNAWMKKVVVGFPIKKSVCK